MSVCGSVEECAVVRERACVCACGGMRVWMSEKSKCVCETEQDRELTIADCPQLSKSFSMHEHLDVLT